MFFRGIGLKKKKREAWGQNIKKKMLIIEFLVGRIIDLGDFQSKNKWNSVWKNRGAQAAAESATALGCILCNPVITQCATWRKASASSPSRTGTMRAKPCGSSVCLKSSASGLPCRPRIWARTVTQLGLQHVACKEKSGGKKLQDHRAFPVPALLPLLAFTLQDFVGHWMILFIKQKSKRFHWKSKRT